jgi:hypothetical protein
MNTCVCTKCKIEKQVADFYKDQRRKTGLQANCKKCFNERTVKYNREFRKNNRELVRAWGRKNSKDDYRRRKDTIVIASKEYYEKNKDQLNKKKVEYTRKKRKTDTLYRTRCLLGSRTLKALKGIGFKKSNTTEEMLGCSYENFLKHLESLFSKGMTWENQGKWHIDHIVPLSSAKNEEELIKLCHYTNTQPLWAKDNLSKSNKIL